MSGPYVLGIAGSHNGALCLLRGDEIVVAIQEERLLRQKRARAYGGLGSLALRYCLDTAGIAASDLDALVVCSVGPARDPINDAAANASLALRPDARRYTLSHHAGHAVAAFATSGFPDAAVLVIDGLGSLYADLSPNERSAAGAQRSEDSDESETSSLYYAKGTELVAVEKHLASRKLAASAMGLLPGRAPGMGRFHSLGMLYGAVGQQIFGDQHDGPGKVMGLAPLGRPSIPIDAFYTVEGDALRYTGTVADRFRHDDRWPAHREAYADLAASAQAALEEAVLGLAQRLREKTGCPRLCYAGGVALNSVANERIVRECGFEQVFIMPAAEDSGTAIGAAYHGLWQLTGRTTQRARGPDSVGRAYELREIDDAIAAAPAVIVEHPDDVIEATTRLLVEGRFVGWFQGRSELGPRALGQRSILCDPRPADMSARLNATVKFREAFRPFAPAILLEHARDWFELDGVTDESPHMLRVARFRPERRDRVPAVVHVDGTGRLQTLTRADNGRFHELVTAFHRATGVPILLNTSFNVAGEPIVETPEDALACLLFSGLEACALGDRVVRKDPAYRSPLDLRFRSRVRHGDLALPFASPAGELDLAVRGCATEMLPALERMRAFEGRARVRVRSPFGEVVQSFDPRWAPLLDHMDGRTGHELLDRARSLVDATVDAAHFVTLLRALRSARIVTIAA